MTTPTAADLWRDGDLDGAIAAQTAVVKSSPTDAEARSLLFAMVAHTGDWDRAASHLRVLAATDPDYERSVQFLRGLLTAEIHRQGVFTGEATPVLPDDTPEHVERRWSALQAWRAGDTAAAIEEIDRAIAAQPDLSGVVDGEDLTAWRDLDDRLGSVCEVFAGGRYLWLPWERIASLELSDPERLPDLIWAPARITQTDGEELSAHLPCRYVGCETWTDPALKLGRGTAWGGDPGLAEGQGQRMFARADVDAEVHEVPLLSLRSLAFTS
jgi:type VI secretion system protein ImpE